MKRVFVFFRTLFPVGILLLCLSMLTAGAFAAADYDEACWQRCLCAPQHHKAEADADSPVPPCCSETQKGCCHFSKGSTPDIQGVLLSVVTENHRIFVEHLVINVEDFSANDLQKEHRRPFHAEITARSSPIYLQHQSLLC